MVGVEEEEGAAGAATAGAGGAAVLAVASSSEISLVRAPKVGTPSSLSLSLMARESDTASRRSSSMSTPAGSASMLLSRRSALCLLQLLSVARSSAPKRAGWLALKSSY